MTAICPGGGPSTNRAGFALSQFVAPAAIGAAFNNTPTQWAIPLAAALGAVTYDLSTICTTDPPAMPAFNSGDVINLLSPFPLPGYAVSLQKLSDLAVNVLWPTFCQCVTGSATLPALPAAPAGSPGVTTLPGPSNACQQFVHDTGPLAFGSGTQVFDGPDFNGLGATYVTAQIHVTDTGAAPANQFTLEYTDTGGITHNILASALLTGPYPLDLTLQGPIGASPARIRIASAHGSTNPSTMEAVWTIAVYCNGQTPSTGAQACCQQDPLTGQQISSILAMVTLLQRQLIPFASILGTVHAGLTGTASIGVADLLGVKVEITTNPGYTGVEAAQPNILFDVGWVSLSTPDGLIDQRPLRATFTTWTPRLMSEATVVGYYLNPGVVATITEINREP